MSGACQQSRCWLNEDERDNVLDMIIGIIVATLLLLGVLICVLFSSACKSSLVEPSSKLRNSYIRATIVFSRMFQRPAKSKQLNLNSANQVWKVPPARLMDANRTRSRRSLGDSSVGMDLSQESSIFYSGTSLANNIVAKGNHLEYFFETPTDPMPLASEQMKLRVAYLPTIRECKSTETVSNAASISDSRGWLRPRIRREIILFTGPEEKREWLEDDDSSTEDFLWAFEEASSEDEHDDHARRPANKAQRNGNRMPSLSSRSS